MDEAWPEQNEDADVDLEATVQSTAEGDGDGVTGEGMGERVGEGTGEETGEAGTGEAKEERTGEGVGEGTGEGTAVLHVDTFTIVAKLQALHAGSQAFGDGTDGAAVDRDICRGYKSVIYMYACMISAVSVHPEAGIPCPRCE